MQPDRPVELGHGREDRLEAGIVERLARDVGEDLDAAGTELADRAPRFLHGALDVGQRDRGDEAGKRLGVLRAQFRHGVVADARELEPGLAGGESSIGGLGSEMISR